MNSPNLPHRLLLALACAAALSGCITLLPDSDPAQLYRFGQTTALPAAAAAAPDARVNVFRTTGAFPRESSGDRILTVNGGEAAYLANARWVAPAQVLFDQALLTAFDTAAGPARLVARGQAGSAPVILRVDVRNFEARYDEGPKAPPTVLVRLRAAMAGGGGQVSEETFEARIPASANRVGAIVAAYDEAVADALGQLVAWTNRQVDNA